MHDDVRWRYVTTTTGKLSANLSANWLFSSTIQITPIGVQLQSSEKRSGNLGKSFHYKHFDSKRKYVRRVYRERVLAKYSGSCSHITPSNFIVYMVGTSVTLDQKFHISAVNQSFSISVFHGNDNVIRK